MKRNVCVLLVLALCLMVCTGCFASREETGETTTTADVTTTTAATTTTAKPTTTTRAPQDEPAAVGFTSFPATGYATDSLNVRRDASTLYTAIGGLYYGEQVTVLGRTGDWYEIQFSWADESGKRQTSAFVSAQYISSVRPQAAPAAPTTQSTAATEPTAVPVD